MGASVTWPKGGTLTVGSTVWLPASGTSARRVSGDDHVMRTVLAAAAHRNGAQSARFPASG